MTHVSPAGARSMASLPTPPWSCRAQPTVALSRLRRAAQPAPRQRLPALQQLLSRNCATLCCSRTEACRLQPLSCCAPRPASRYAPAPTGRRKRTVCRSGGDGGAGRANEIAALRRQFLLQYVADVQPGLLESFSTRAPPEVVDAMRQTIANMLGTLPPQYFEVTINAVGENLAQLLYSVMMTGYLFRNAQYRRELRRSVAAPALPGGLEATSGANSALPAMLPTSQQRGVSGAVLRWSDAAGLETLPAGEYIADLESEVRRLRDTVAALQRAGEGRNPLLEDLKAMEPSNLSELTTRAGDDVLEAMNSFITRLMGGLEGEGLALARGNMAAPELARLLYWLLVVGYSLRTIEVRFDLDAQLGLPPSAPDASGC